MFPANQLDNKEFFHVILLNVANRVLGVLKISEGGLTSTVADIREIFQIALKCNAISIIVSHNHPSGDLAPSVSDKNLTNKISDADKLLEIKLLDHIILTSEGFFSFADEGLLY